MAKWIEYTGSDEQIRELKANTHGYMVRNIPPITGFILSPRIRYAFELSGISEVKFEYLICEPHPYADIIKIWADTGCEVWIKPHKPYSFKISDYENNPYAKLLVNEAGVIIVTTKPDWNMNAEYRLTPFEGAKE